jgi:hypothetical protein
LSVTKITDGSTKGRTVSLNSEVGEEHTSDVTAVENITEISNYLFNNPSKLKNILFK